MTPEQTPTLHRGRPRRVSQQRRPSWARRVRLAVARRARALLERAIVALVVLMQRTGRGWG